MKKLLRAYFFWTYPRGSFHYDVMVTLILAFIFITPRFWNFNDHPPQSGPDQPIQVTGSGFHRLMLTVPASDVHLAEGASNTEVKMALRRAIEPVTGDAVYIEEWKTDKDADGSSNWKVWIHR